MSRSPAVAPWYTPRALVAHNPFYLLSAACMLLACLLLSNTTTWSPIPLKQLLILIATLSVYELLLVGLGLYLVRRRGCRRDGVMLIILEAFFLVDVGFLNSEVAQLNLSVGIQVNAVLMLLAVAKVYAIFRVMKIGVGSPALGLCLTMLAALTALPLAIKHASNLQNGDLPEQTLYAAWWVVALLAAAYGMLVRHGKLLGDMDAGTRRVTHTFLILALISLTAHLGTSHWVYDAPYRSPDASPMLLALAVLMTAVTPGMTITRSDARVLSGILPIAAVLTALPAARPLSVNAFDVQLTPLALTVAASYCTFVYCVLLHFARAMLAAGAAVGAVWIFGPTPASVAEFAARCWREAIAFSRRLLPETQAAWGMISLVGSFLLLAVGAAVSLLRRPHDEHAVAVPSENG